jgi:3-methyladenine DNA glycosylase AlkC
MAENEEKVLFKDGINEQTVRKLGSALLAAWPQFPLAEFVASGAQGLSELELKARVRHLMAAMTQFLPADYPVALDIVQRAGMNWPAKDPDNSFDGFAAWPLIDWVGTEGVAHPTISLQALRQLTPLFSAEFAIRPFLLEHTESTLADLHTWIDDDNPHVRRLISEGTRPRLPWGQQLPMFRKDPAPVLELLEKLKDDDSEYVRRSVANNLNDIAKDHPDLVAKVARKWMKNASQQRRRLIIHALRTLIKQGHPGAMKVMGFEIDPKVDVNFGINANRVVMGDELLMTAEITSTGSRVQKLVIDFAVHYRKSNASLSPKVFKWKVLDLAPGQTVRLEKKHRFVSRSVRKLYAGGHEIALTIAGSEWGKCSFKLVNG